jgi:post-segregation antitoxin (ccd killing protein)
MYPWLCREWWLQIDLAAVWEVALIAGVHAKQRNRWLGGHRAAIEAYNRMAEYGGLLRKVAFLGAGCCAKKRAFI